MSHPQYSFNSQWGHVHVHECLCTKYVSFCFYKITGNASIAIRMRFREGRIPTLELPKILNCNENLDSLASQVTSNYYLKSDWDSASFQEKRKLRQEICICVTFLKTLQKAKWTTKVFFSGILGMHLLCKWPEFPAVIVLFCLVLPEHSVPFRIS